jgi:hypothetical protein
MEAGRDRERPIESEHRACTSFTVENQARCLEITACSAGTSFWLALTVTHGTDPLYRVVTELQSICGRFRDRVRETCRPVEIRLWLSSQRKQPVPHKHPYERSRQAKASRHGQKHLSGGDIYFGGPFIVLGVYEKCVREHKRLIHDFPISIQIEPAENHDRRPKRLCAWPPINMYLHPRAL